MTRRIGFEYEGVLLRNGKNIRWSELSEEEQKCVTESAGSTQPYDNYDCLAETRTFAQPCKNPHTLLDNLYRNIERTTAAYSKVGIHVAWEEQAIPTKIHQSIAGAMQEKKSKHITYTIDKHQGRMIVEPPTERKIIYRGGGLHINVDAMNETEAYGLAIRIHEALRRYRNPKMKSWYRTQLLFRIKPFGVEYVSFGFNLPDEDTTMKFGDTIHFIRHQFHWAEALLYIINSLE